MSKIRVKQINETELASFVSSTLSGDLSSIYSDIDGLITTGDTLSGEFGYLVSDFLTLSGQNSGIDGRLNAIESVFANFNVDLSALSGDITELQDATGVIVSQIGIVNDALSGISGNLSDLSGDMSGIYDFKTGYIYNYINLIDVKASGVGGGTFSGGGWRTRLLNSEVSDSGNLCSNNSGILTLSGGLYSCDISCPALGVGSHVARLYNVSDAESLLSGTMEYAGNFSSRSFIKGRFVVPGSTGKLISIQHLCANTVSGSGFGSGMGLNDADLVNIYTIAEFTRIPT